MKGRTHKVCGCSDPQTGKRLAGACPQLRRANGTWNPEHGTWHIQVELAPRPDGRRRTLRRGGFTTQRDAQAEIDKIAALFAMVDRRDKHARAQISDLLMGVNHRREPIPNTEQARKQLQTGGDLDGMPTVGEWLDRWLGSRRNIRDSTVYFYTSNIRTALKPHLGHIPLDRLNVDHLAAMFDAIVKRNEAILAARASDDPKVQASVRGQRVIRPATMHRYRGTLRAALNAAIRAQLITFNPASYVELPSGKRPKALPWTGERIRHWKATGQLPSAVMLWTPEQTGRFLDHSADDPLYALFHLIALRGLRRGEACGLPWAETDLDNQTIAINTQLSQVGWKPVFGKPKSDASGRIVALDDTTTEALRRHRARQNQQRLAAGSAWFDSGLVFTNPDGTPLHPAKVTDRFQELTGEAGLPPIRLHSLRHGAATIALAAGADLRVVQDLLGHSSIAITADTYAHVLPELSRDTAQAAARLVPRAKGG